MTSGHNRDVWLAQTVELGDLLYNLHVIFGFEKTKTNKQKTFFSGICEHTVNSEFLTHMARQRLDRSIPAAIAWHCDSKSTSWKEQPGLAWRAIWISLIIGREMKKKREKLPLCLVHSDRKCAEVTAQEVLFSFVMKRFRWVEKIILWVVIILELSPLIYNRCLICSSMCEEMSNLTLIIWETKSRYPNHAFFAKREVQAHDEWWIPPSVVTRSS